MAFKDLIDITSSQFKKKYKNSNVDFVLAKDLKPITGLIVDNPLLEFILDRRFIAYGRFILSYGRKGSGKTSTFYELAKLYQANGGDVVWIETENAIDRDYAVKQGVDLSKVTIQHPESFEQGLELIEMYLRSMPKAYPEGDTPVLLCLDSIAGIATEDELDAKHTLTDSQPGVHARRLSRFFRETDRLLANEKCNILLINQLRSKIGAFGFSDDSQDALLGGESQFFYSTYHFKFARTKEFEDNDEHGAPRKTGSRHKIQCKRNKLGREGKGQEVEVDLYINGGMDWWGPLVRKLGESYTDLVADNGSGYFRWVGPPSLTLKLENNEPVLINSDEQYRCTELALQIARSNEAKEHIRKAFGIPDLPPIEEIQQVENTRKTRRKKSTTNEQQTEKTIDITS
jgi:recombination protein RecA